MIAPIYPPAARFRKLPGGAIVDTQTGIAIAHVSVTQLDTETADRLSDVIIAALDAGCGPQRTVGGAA